MAQPRYAQFCALARAAEIIGERWTLLIVRELLLGPKRFSDLRNRLDGISSSVLTERLARLEESGILAQSYLEPPAASNVYELTEDGLALKPAIFELIRWGGRYLFPRRENERTEPDWMRLALSACARKVPAPDLAFELRIVDSGKTAVIHVAGGLEGTVVTEGAADADASIETDFPTLLRLVGGGMDPVEAAAEGKIEVGGDTSKIASFPELFS